MKDLFIVSDLHLDPEPMEHPGRECFLSFLSSLKCREEAGQLWILGDLFDFWFEYGSVVPAGYSGILSALGTLSSKGWEVHFLPGNHDFWVGRHFRAATGAIVHSEQIVELDMNGRTIALAHGDGLGSGDIGYRMMKPVLRCGLSRILFGLLHPDIGSFLARAFSGTSRRVLRKEADSIPSGLGEWVDHRLNDGTDVDVTRHTHVDSLVRRDPGIHVSLGDWLVRMTYCIIPGNGDDPVLETWTGCSEKSARKNCEQGEGSCCDE